MIVDRCMEHHRSILDYNRKKWKERFDEVMEQKNQSYPSHTDSFRISDILFVTVVHILSEI